MGARIGHFPSGVYERPPGSGKLGIRYRRPGERWFHREQLGRVSPKVAAGILAERLRAIREGDPVVGRGPRVADVIRDYLAFGEPHWETRTLRHYTAYGRRCIEALGQVRAHEITPAEVQKYLHRRAQSVSGVTSNKDLQFILAAFRWAVRVRRIARNPFPTGALRRFREMPRERELSRDEQARILAELPERYRPLLHLAIATGLRQDNLCKLEWSWVDFERGKVSIPATRHKNRKPHVVVMSPGVREILLALPTRVAGRRYVFEALLGGHEGAWAGKPVNAHNFMATIWRPALKRAGIENLHWHDLRHTTATRLSDKGVPIQKIQRVLGQRSIQSTKIYTHVSDEALVSVMALLDDSRPAAEASGANGVAHAEEEGVDRQLERLAALYEKGALTPSQFEAAKEATLRGAGTPQPLPAQALRSSSPQP